MQNEQAICLCRFDSAFSLYLCNGLRNTGKSFSTVLWPENISQ